MTRKPNLKTNANGGRVNPVLLPKDYQPLLEPWTDEFYEAAMAEALEVRQATHAGEAWTSGSVIGRFMEKYTGEALMTPMYRYLIENSPDFVDDGSTDAQHAAIHVEMDDPINLPRGVRDYANREGWEIHEQYRRCEYPNEDFITRTVGAAEFMITGMTETMDICFAEKVYWEPLHQRPEEYFCNCGPILTPYLDGCPCHGSRPAGHGAFAGHTSAGAVRFYNGHDYLIVVTTKQLAASRTLSLMHNGPENMEGWQIGDNARF